MRVRDGKGTTAGVADMMGNMVAVLEMVIRELRTKDNKDF